MLTGAEEFHKIKEMEDFDDSNTWKKENIFSTLLDLDGKSKDNLKARWDLKKWGIREELHPLEKISRSGIKRYELPPAPYTMSKDEKRRFCKTLNDIKVPNASNICVNLQQAKLLGLKSHDCHILMQQILPVALRGLLSKDVLAILFDLCGYFRDICSKNLDVDELKRHEAQIPIIIVQAGELKRRSRPRHLTLNVIERLQHETFHDWFRQHGKTKSMHEPYIFATQAEQVFYVEDYSDLNWLVAIKMKPKDVYDLGDDDIREDKENELYHISILKDILDDGNGNLCWLRRGVEGTMVDDDS
uniref:DUF4216 domain-containing protein n=1 Tax=Chenopodium quinoa TaxID=63459 RepID=A0A803MZE6_CHEQI